MKSSVVLGVALLAAATGAGALLLRVGALSRDVQELRAELAAVKAGQVTPEIRKAVLALIEESRVERKRQQAEDENQRFRQMTEASADRLAQKYGLAADQRARLVDLLYLSREKMDAMEAQMRELASTGDVDAVTKASHEAFEDLEAWRRDELVQRLGAELAERVAKDSDFGMLADAARVQTSRPPR